MSDAPKAHTEPWLLQLTKTAQGSYPDQQKPPTLGKGEGYAANLGSIMVVKQSTTDAVRLLLAGPEAALQNPATNVEVNLKWWNWQVRRSTGQDVSLRETLLMFSDTITQESLILLENWGLLDNASADKAGLSEEIQERAQERVRDIVLWLETAIYQMDALFRGDMKTNELQLYRAMHMVLERAFTQVTKGRKPRRGWDENRQSIQILAEKLAHENKRILGEIDVRLAKAKK